MIRAGEIGIRVDFILIDSDAHIFRQWRQVRIRDGNVAADALTIHTAMFDDERHRPGCFAGVDLRVFKSYCLD